MQKTEAIKLLEELGAAKALLRHAELVGSTAGQLILTLQNLHVPIERDVILAGAVLHDAGKIVHPEELVQAGHQHEAAGEKLPLEHGISPQVARCCVSHGQWERMTVSLEELVVALADKLWKGKRDHALEERIVRQVSDKTGDDYWTVFSALDASCEEIAGHAEENLRTS